MTPKTLRKKKSFQAELQNSVMPFFLSKAEERTAPPLHLCVCHPENNPASGGAEANIARGRCWRKHSVLMSKRACRGNPCPQCRLRAEPFDNVAEKFSEDFPRKIGFDKIVKPDLI